MEPINSIPLTLLSNNTPASSTNNTIANTIENLLYKKDKHQAECVQFIEGKWEFIGKNN